MQATKVLNIALNNDPSCSFEHDFWGKHIGYSMKLSSEPLWGLLVLFPSLLPTAQDKLPGDGLLTTSLLSEGMSERTYLLLAT